MGGSDGSRPCRADVSLGSLCRAQRDILEGGCGKLTQRLAGLGPWRDKEVLTKCALSEPFRIVSPHPVRGAELRKPKPQCAFQREISRASFRNRLFTGSLHNGRKSPRPSGLRETTRGSPPGVFLCADANPVLAKGFATSGASGELLTARCDSEESERGPRRNATFRLGARKQPPQTL